MSNICRSTFEIWSTEGKIFPNNTGKAVLKCSWVWNLSMICHLQSEKKKRKKGKKGRLNGEETISIIMMLNTNSYRPTFFVLEFVAMHCLFDTEAQQVAIKAFYHIMFLCIPGNGYSGKLLVIALYDALSTGIANKLSLFHNVHKQKSLWSSTSIKLE